MTFLLLFSIQFTLLLFSSILIYPLLLHFLFQLLLQFLPCWLPSLLNQLSIYPDCLLQIESLLQHPPSSLLLPVLWNSPPWCSLSSVQLRSTCFPSRPYNKRLSASFLFKCPSAILFLFHHLLLSGTISHRLIVSLTYFLISFHIL